MASLKFKEIMCLLYSGLLFISGAILVGFSVVLSYKLYYHFTFVPTETIGPFVIIFLTGIVHLFITWVGLKGPSKEHDFFIIAFVIFTILLLVIELAVGIWSLIIWSSIEFKSLEIMKESQLSYLQHDYDKKEWDLLHKKLHCCGLNGAQDYRKKGQMPFSCFKCDETDVVSKNNNCSETYQTGCGSPFTKYIESLLVQASLVAFLSGLFQVAGIVAFVLFYKALKEERAIRAANRANRLRQSLNSRPRAPAPSIPNVPNVPNVPTVPTAPTN